MKPLFFAIAFWMLAIASVAQQQPLSFSFANDNIEAVVRMIEAKTDYRFYYKDDDVRNVKVTVVADAATM